MANKKATKKDALLSTIVDATKASGFTHAEQTPDLKALVDSGHVEADPSNMLDGKIAVRATAKAVETVADSAPSSVAEPIAIVSGLEIPVTKAGSKEETYPFSQLEVGQSFFVPIGPEKFASTVSSASRRFAVKTDSTVISKRTGQSTPVLQYTRKFTGRSVKAGQKYSNGFVESQDGTRVFRTA
jgi:hypothetical protein